MSETMVPADVTTLSSDVRGPVLLPGQAGYDQDRAGFNRAVSHHPAVIVGAVDARDVQLAVRFAADRDLAIAVQATGHGATTQADDAMLISTHRMDDVHIDPDRRQARISAGTRWQHVIERAAPSGLAPLNGSSPHVGAVSYTLGGGLPVLGRRFGWAADHVRRAEIVTADGRLRTVTPEQDEEIFWAIRGGKGNFGVVTSMDIDLVPVDRLYGGGLYFPGEMDDVVLPAWREWTVGLPPEVASSIAVLRLPDVPAVPVDLRGRTVVHVRVAYLGPSDTGDELVRPLRDLGPRMIDSLGDMPYTEMSRIHDDPTEPMPYRESSTMLREFDAAAVDTLIETAGSRTRSSLTLVEVRHLGGALSVPPDVPNAVGHRDAAYSLMALSTAQPGTAEIDTLLARMAPWSTGRRFINFVNGPEAAPAVDAYEPDAFARLAAVKATYDPRNLFRLNHNITPTRGF